MAQLAREGAQMSAQHLRDLENRRRHATLIAVLLDTEATITDQILDMHDRIDRGADVQRGEAQA
jgi:hypothetical protein